MAELYIAVLRAFGFEDMEIWIAVVSTILFSACLLGGILSALTFVKSPRLERRPLGERISYRLFIIAEVMLLIFIFYYHVFMIETITLAHAIYWVSAMLMMPLLAIIGSESVLLIYGKKIRAKAKELKRRARLKRCQDKAPA